MRREIFAVIFLFLILLEEGKSVRSKKVFVHYLPWYDSSGLRFATRTGWCYPASGQDCSDLTVKHYSNEPLIGEYSLFDTDVIEYHLLQIFVTGFDGVIVNINPKSEMQKNGALALVQKMVELSNSFTAFEMKYIISYDVGGVGDEAEILEYMTWSYDNFYGNAVFASHAFHDDETGKAVYITWSEANPPFYYSTIRSLFNNNVILIIRNARNFNVSDGNMEWVGPLNYAPPKNNTSNYGQQMFNDMDWIMARQTEVYNVPEENVNHIMLGSVYAGFDDENVPPFWNGGTNRYIFRSVDAGETMSLLWQRQIDFVPKRLGGSDTVDNPWLQIVTWNDWPEGTSIEPATEDTYGYRALEIAHEKIPIFKRASTARFHVDYLREPHAIYQLRKQGLTSNADARVQTLMSSNGFGGAQGDPHFTGFDGSKFDFHGKHGENYIVYGRMNDDLLVAKVRSTTDTANGLKKSYFQEFGLQTSKSLEMIRFFLNQYEAGRWSLECTLKKRPISLKEIHKGLNIKIDISQNKINVSTEKHKFIIRGISLNSKSRHHLDFEVIVKKGINSFDQFTGILGMTLSRKLGRKVQNEIDGKLNSTEFESLLQKVYRVNRLFPRHSDLQRLYNS